MWNDFLFSVNATLPVFGVMALGFLLRRGGFLTHGFCQVANKLVFHLCLPAMLFRQIAAIRGGSLPDGAFLLYATTVGLSPEELERIADPVAWVDVCAVREG